MATIKLIIVDLDGTLVDTKDVNYNAYKEALAIYGYSIDYDFFCKYCNGRHYLDFLPQIVEDKTLWAEIHRIKLEKYHNYLPLARVNDSLVQLLTIMREQGCKIALVTTASAQNTNEMLSDCNVRDGFDLILTREDVAKCKPDPEGFIKAMNHFQVSAAETAIFEDSEVGIEAAVASKATVYRVLGYN